MDTDIAKYQVTTITLTEDQVHVVREALELAGESLYDESREFGADNEEAQEAIQSVLAQLAKEMI